METTNKTSQKPKLTLRTKIVAGIVIPLILLLTVVGVYLSSEITSIVTDLKTTDITAQAGSNQTEAFFEPFLTVTKVMTDLDITEKIFDEIQSSGSSYDIQDSEYYKEALDELVEIASNSGSDVLMTWYSSFKNSQLFSSDGYVSEKGWDVTTRLGTSHSKQTTASLPYLLHMLIQTTAKMS